MAEQTGVVTLMNDAKKPKFQSKVVRFGSHSITLFSIDGVTWSTRRDELQRILERHEQERLGLANLKDPSGGAAKGKPAKGPKKAAASDTDGEAIVEPEAEDEDGEEDVADADIEPAIVATAEVEVEDPEYNTIVPGTIKDESPRLVALDKQIDKMLGLDNIVALQRRDEPASPPRKPFIKGKISKPEVKKIVESKKVAAPVKAKVAPKAPVAPVAKKAAKPQKMVAPKKRATSKPKAKKQKAKARGRARAG